MFGESASVVIKPKTIRPRKYISHASASFSPMPKATSPFKRLSIDCLDMLQDTSIDDMSDEYLKSAIDVQRELSEPAHWNRVVLVERPQCPTLEDALDYLK